MPISRRKFLTTAAAGVAGAAVASGGLHRLAEAAGPFGVTHPQVKPRGLPSPHDSGIEHIVVLCMENRSFDHFLGWVPGANGQQAGLTYLDDAGAPHATHRLETWTGCGFNDPDHSYEGGRVQYDGGALDGFRRGGNDDYALGYYTGDQLPTTTAVVDGFTVCDNYFCSILGPTYPNRFYTHAAATDRITNVMTQQSFLPTVWDLLAGAGVPANYYFSDLPFLALWANKYVSIARPVDTFFAQAASGTLPAYSYIDPFFLGEDQGGSNDDHPHADIRRGQSFIARVVNALMASPCWSKTVLVVTYDEWGGFFDHVAPPSLPDAFTPTATEEHNTAGFRVPTYVISPFAARGRISSVQFDHTSILKMVAWRWNLPSLTPRDAAANNLALALDFAHVNPTSTFPSPADPGPHYCNGSDSIGMGNSEAFWEDLRDSSLLRTWGSLV